MAPPPARPTPPTAEAADGIAVAAVRERLAALDWHSLCNRLQREAGVVLRRLDGRDTITAANHAFGSARMSRRSADGVVDEDGRCHDLDNVYVADTSIFPGSPAVNPMLTCMALADRIACGIASRW